MKTKFLAAAIMALGAADGFAQMVAFDNFETTPSGVVAGNPPPNPPWSLLSTNAQNNALVAAGIAHSGPNALHMFDNTNTVLVTATRTFVETNRMPNGQISFDLRLDDVSSVQASSIEILAPNTNNFFIPQRILALEFNKPSTVRFRLQGGSFPVFTSNFPTNQFEHIIIGWQNMNLGAGGTYFVTWNGITNTAPLLFNTFTNIVAFRVNGNSVASSTYDLYLDNLVLEVPEPAGLAWVTMGAVFVLWRRRTA